MENAPKISVIVPVYKAEKYLARCVDSLLAQTFRDFEIILIDDGSPDKSGEICDNYAKKDSRVRVIHQENGGVSVARQRGNDEARGEYVIHADPDDWTEPSMLAELYAKAKEENADMVFCDFYDNFSPTRSYYHAQPTGEENAENFLKKVLSQQLNAACWNKLIKRDFYEANSVRFPDGAALGEDLYFNCELLRHNPRVAYLPRAFYHYDRTLNQNSATRYRTEKNLRSLIAVIDHFIATLDNNVFAEEFYKVKIFAKRWMNQATGGGYGFIRKRMNAISAKIEIAFSRLVAGNLLSF